MAAFSSFDQWKKDAFFSAAEEVQESVDAMESMFRMWIRSRGDEHESEFSDELRTELQTCLGTAKWQLEEFETAVGASHGNYPSEENTITRHKEFVTALRHQISYVEKAMNDSLLAEGKQPMRWVQVDADETDDFETFLSSASGLNNFPEIKDKFVNRESVRGFKETVTINKDAKYVVEVAAKDASSSNNDEMVVFEDNSSKQKKLMNPMDVDAWKIVIADEVDVKEKLVEPRPETRKRSSSLCGFLRSIESTTRLKLFRKVKSEEHVHSRRGFLSYFGSSRNYQLAQGRNGLSERCKEDGKGANIQQSVGYGRFLRVTLLLMVIFLVVPFVLYSS